MLFGEYRGRHQNGNLVAVLDDLEGSSGSNFGLAVPDIAADQAVHGLILGEIVDDIIDGLGLARGLVIGEGFLQFPVQVAGRGEPVPLADSTASIDVEQVLGYLPDCFRDLFLGRQPALGTKTVELRCLIGKPLVATDPVKPVYRDIEFVVIPIGNEHEIAALSGKFHVDQSLKNPDAVVAMHHSVIESQLVDLDWLAFASPF